MYVNLCTKNLQLIHRHKCVAAVAVEVDDVGEDSDRGLTHCVEEDNRFVGGVGGSVIENVFAAGGGVGAVFEIAGAIGPVEIFPAVFREDCVCSLAVIATRITEIWIWVEAGRVNHYLTS